MRVNFGKCIIDEEDVDCIVESLLIRDFFDVGGSNNKLDDDDVLFDIFIVDSSLLFLITFFVFVDYRALMLVPVLDTMTNF